MGIHQDLMHGAYKKWRHPLRYVQFLMELDVKERRAVVLGNLNYQVENGGFLQWRDNGYDANLSFVYDAINAIGTDLSKQVCVLVEKACVETEAPYDDEEREETQGVFDALDKEYYAINTAFMAECEKFFEDK